MDRTIPLMLMRKAKEHPDFILQYSKDGGTEFKPVTYQEMLEDVAIMASALLEIGVKRGDRIGLISDNRKEWLVSDIAIMSIGAVDVPRGCDAIQQELSYILSWSGCKTSFLENEKQLEKILEIKKDLPELKTLILFEKPEAPMMALAEKAGLKLLHFRDLEEAGKERRKKNPGEFLEEAEKGQANDMATIIYTSGTTGEPKGVMLSHSNFIHQCDALPEMLLIGIQEIWLSVLPVWHSFERLVQYAIIGTSSSIAYSKPVASIMLADFLAIRPHWMASVPRIWESVRDGVYRNIRQSGKAKQLIFSFFMSIAKAWASLRNMLLGRLPDFGNRIRFLDIVLPPIPMIFLAPLRGLGEILVFKTIKQKLGGRFLMGISGGGAMPGSVDVFFDAVGVRIMEGYGLTETAPVLAVRLRKKPIMSTVGPAMRGTEFKIVDDDGVDLGVGKKGNVWVRGPQVMLGYYKKPELTEKVMKGDGWLDTGDIGMLTKDRNLRLTGRAKDTIVLRGGENVEPLPIEQRLNDSIYIQQSVVLGQDERFLVALIVADQENTLTWAGDNGLPELPLEELIKRQEVRELFDFEISQAVNQAAGFRLFERIFRFELLFKPFEVGKELSAKQEIKRHAIAEIYKAQIEKMFSS